MKLGVTLDILNQKGTPAFNADTLGNRPAAGFTGRMFISTDTFAFYRDTGTSWDLIGGPGSGTITGSGAAGQVTYFDGTLSITGSNNLFWDTTNNRLGVNTNTPTSTFDVHGTTNVISQLNQLTSGQNALLTFQDNSVGKWRLGNIYNAAAHDFGIVDITNTLQRLTIKNTGQTFIGAEVTSSGLFVVNSATSDNHIVVTGANAPSIRLNNGSSVKQGGIAISTATNNFIQGSADRDFCVFNSSTTASPILFGVWNGTNTQEVARVSSSRNFLVGSSTDTGQKFQVTGTSYFSSNVLIGTSTSSGARLDVVSGAGANTYFNSTGSGIYLQIANNGTNLGYIGDGTILISGGSATDFVVRSQAALSFSTNGNTERMRITSGGNVLIGVATAFSAGYVCIKQDSTVYNLLAIQNTATTGNFQVFVNSNGTQAGAITNLSSGTLYTTTSDYRLKEDLKEYNGLNLINSIKTYDYKIKSDNTRMYGVMAHELQDIIPYSVIGLKDGKEMQSVDYSKLVPILIKAVQELNIKIENFK